VATWKPRRYGNVEKIGETDPKRRKVLGETPGVTTRPHGRRVDTPKKTRRVGRLITYVFLRKKGGYPVRKKSKGVSVLWGTLDTVGTSGYFQWGRRGHRYGKGNCAPRCTFLKGNLSAVDEMKKQRQAKHPRTSRGRFCRNIRQKSLACRRR